LLHAQTRVTMTVSTSSVGGRTRRPRSHAITHTINHKSQFHSLLTTEHPLYINIAKKRRLQLRQTSETLRYVNDLYAKCSPANFLLSVLLFYWPFLDCKTITWQLRHPPTNDDVTSKSTSSDYQCTHS